MGSCKPGRLDILGPGRGASPYRTSTRPPLFRWAQTEHSKWFVTRTLFLFPIKSGSRGLIGRNVPRRPVTGT
jgi:hypothetical protein